MTPKHIPKSNLMPYSPSTFNNFILTKEDEQTLAENNFLMKEFFDYDNTKRTIGIQDITASKRNILDQILDLPNYVGKVPKLKRCSIYYENEDEDKVLTIRAKMNVDIIFGYTVSK